MKKFVCLYIVFSLGVTGVFSQQKKTQENPDEQVIVNKRYDEHGNLTQYDSTYIHRWSRDTTFHFGFPGDSLGRWDFPGIEQFMNEFWNDTPFGSPSFPHQPFSLGFRFSPFDTPDNQAFRDSVRGFEFPYQFDSLFFDFGFGPDEAVPPGFSEDFFEDFEKRLNRHFFRFRDDQFGFQGFHNDEHLKEWEELIQKHQRELEEFQKKWDQKETPGKKL